MNKVTIAAARMAARRFLDAERSLSDADERCRGDAKRFGYKPVDKYYGSKESGALRRASLDLTRALAEMRKP